MSDAATTSLPDTACPRCREPHGILECPYVKAVEYFDDGGIRRIEFLTPDDMAPVEKPEPPQQDYPRLGSK